MHLILEISRPNYYLYFKSNIKTSKPVLAYDVKWCIIIFLHTYELQIIYIYPSMQNNASR